MTAFSLKRILSTLKERGLVVSVSADLPNSVRRIRDDSRAVQRGDLFIAVRGSVADGHAFLKQAKEKGAVAAIVERTNGVTLPHIVVTDSRRAAAIAAATFHRFPANELLMVGVTGTNGKTTTVNLLRHVLGKHERPAASLGTLGVLIGSEGDERPMEGSASLTTPGPIELQQTLRSLVERGVRSVAMEVSSHSLDQRRADGIEFDAAVFTNLSRDHIDYHGSMEAYLAAKARLLELLRSGGSAVINADDSSWNALDVRDARRITFSVERGDADVTASDIRYKPGGSEWLLNVAGERYGVSLPLVGAFNISNALACAATAWSLGLSPGAVAASLSGAPQVPGRMERLHDNPVVLRDYSHTPDALERAIRAVAPFAPNGVLVVFGCGGDRDRGKRPIMGEIAARLASRAIITSDNPRTEDPERILDEIEAGMPAGNHERVEDRRQAILRAIDIASESGEVVLLAGKGHETYQIRGHDRLHFDEREIVAEIMGVRR